MPASLKVLIVEDQKNLSESLTRVLKSRGFEVQLAGSFTEGVQCILKDEIDIILSDYMLPDGNGIDLYEKCISKNNECRFILMTGLAIESIPVPKNIESNFTLLQKPFRIKQLLELVKFEEI